MSNAIDLLSECYAAIFIRREIYIIIINKSFNHFESS